jgi:hypothetical protein
MDATSENGCPQKQRKRQPKEDKRSTQILRPPKNAALNSFVA